MTPAALHVEESLGTLKFANSAKNIACKPKVNEVLDDKTLIKRYEKQIESLKKELDSLKSEKTEATTLMASPSVAIDFPTSQPASDVNTPTKLTSEEIVQRDTELLALLKGGIISARKMKSTSATKARQLRRQTWCPPSALGGGSAVLDDPTEQLIFSPIAKAAVPRMRDSLVDDLLNPSFALDLTDGGDPFSESSTSSVNGNPRRSNSGLVDSSALVMELKHKIARLEDELAQSLQDAEIARAGESHAVEQVKTIEDALRKEINELNANILNSQKIIEEKVEIIAFTEKKLADKEQEQQQSAVPPAGISNEEKEQLEQQIAALQDQLKEEQDMSEMLEKQFVDETLELEKNYQEQVEALTAEREGFAAQIDELKQKSDADLVAVNQAKEQVELFKASVEAAQAKSKIAEEEASKLRVELESAAKRASESEKELEYKQLEIEKLTWDLEIRENDAKDLEILREQVAQLQGQIDVSASIAAEIEALRVENMELKAKIDQSPLISLEEIESLRGELDQVKTAYQASMERCSEFEKENTELVHTLTETSSMIDDLKAQIATLEDAAVVAAAAQGNAAESFANLQAEHAQVCAKVQELHTIAAAAGKSAETGKQLMRAENEVLQLRTQLNSITEKHEQLQEKYSEVVAQISKLRTEQEAVSGSEKQLSAIKVAQENTAAEHQRAIEKLQAALREQQDQSAHKSSEHKQALGAIEEKLKSLQSHNALLTAELTAAKEHEEAARQEADTLRSRSRQLEQESNSMSSTAYKSDNDAQAMKKKISQLQQTLDLTNQTMAKLERQIKEVEEERKSADQRANSLQRQIDDAAAAQAKAQQNQRSNANGAYLEAQLDEIKRKFQQEKTALESEVARLRPLASNAASLSNEVFDLQKANEKIMKEKKELMVDASVRHCFYWFISSG
jgi:chromosome segregation ATPase